MAQKLHRTPRPSSTVQNQHAIGEIVLKSQPETDALTEKYSFRWFNVGLLLYSIVTYTGDVVWDMVVANNLYQTGQMWYFGLTLSFIVVPAVVMMLFSLKWYIEDSKKQGAPQHSTLGWTVRVIFHFLLLGPVVRYIDTLIYGIQHQMLEGEERKDEMKKEEEKETYHNWLKYEEADAGYLRLFEAFMEAAPQTLLQLYILVQPDSKDDFRAVILRIVSIFFSMISLSSGLVTQQRSMRLSQKEAKKPTYCASFVQFGWYLFMNISRMLSLGLFNSLYPKYMAIIFFVRWLVATVWLVKRKTHFFESDTNDALESETKVEPVPRRNIKLSCIAEFVYNCALGVVFLFAYVNPVSGRTRWRYTVYYITIFIENAVLISVWFVCVDDDRLWYKFTDLLAVFLSFFLGIAFMLIYYLELHPSGNIEIFLEEEKISVGAEVEEKEPLETTLDTSVNTQLELNTTQSSGFSDTWRESISSNSAKTEQKVDLQTNGDIKQRGSSPFGIAHPGTPV